MIGPTMVYTLFVHISKSNIGLEIGWRHKTGGSRILSPSFSQCTFIAVLTAHVKGRDAFVLNMGCIVEQLAGTLRVLASTLLRLVLLKKKWKRTYNYFLLFIYTFLSGFDEQ